LLCIFFSHSQNLFAFHAITLPMPQHRIRRVQDPKENFIVPLTDICYGGYGPCLYAILLPPCAAATALQVMTDSDWYFNCLCLNTPAGYRSIIREGYHIEGTAADDVYHSCLCMPCSLVQNLNEVLERGRAKPRGRHEAVQKWLSEPFDPISNIFNTIVGMMCMPCAFGWARSNFDGTNFFFNLFCLTPCMMRSIIRKGYNLPGHCCIDIWFTLCCPFFAAIQLLNEVERRGNINMYTIKAPLVQNEMERN